MIAIADHRLPQEAKKSLTKFAAVFEFSTKDITYDAVSGHPDIFLCETGNAVTVAPNIPSKYIAALKSSGTEIIKGTCNAGNKYPYTARYNALVTPEYLIHNLDITDETILKLCADKIKIKVRQGYTRCSLFAVDRNSFITSDKGIYKTLEKYNVDILFADSSKVVLPGFSHGFIGGCFGKAGNRVFVSGNLNFVENGDRIREFITKKGFEIIELYNGPLFDGGGLFFF